MQSALTSPYDSWANEATARIFCWTPPMRAGVLPSLGRHWLTFLRNSVNRHLDLLMSTMRNCMSLREWHPHVSNTSR